MAREDPARTALEIDERRVSYGEFNEQADRLAQRLVQALGTDQDRVALRANGTHELAVGFLGIQRAGMVAVPVDPTAPLDRLQAILADVEPSLLLSDVEGDETLGLSPPVFHPLIFGAGTEAAPIDLDRGELVSIVYTSGSTGTPKGIMMGREQMNALFAGLSHYPVETGTRAGIITAGTVGPVESVVGSVLVLRGTLVAYEIRRHGIGPLGGWLESSNVGTSYLVPTVLRYLLPTLPAEHRLTSLRLVVLGGETATWQDVTNLRRHLSDEAMIVNAFGQTETISISSFDIPADAPAGEGPLPAGTVHPHMDLSILDPDGRPVAPGERGEIVVASHALALGYWRRPDLTRATFRELPDGRREVRTGDAGRLGPDGVLQHLGRLDHLVKISGNRVELGEVEHALARADGVAAAAAASYTDETQNTRLAACVVPRRAARLDTRVLRATLSRQLPGYMVPDHIAVIDELPALPGGKVDRSRVAELGLSEAQRNEAPAAGQSELERALEAIWREILQLDGVDRNDDFFLIGGDSMRAARMFVEISRRLGIDRPVSLLVEAPTIASLALMLSDASAWDALLAVRTEGSKPPLFVVHDGGGSVLYSRGLAAALGPDQPIYGLRCEALNGSPVTEGSYPELAATYVRRIQALYPDGPYVLYGVSLGGVIALEMARQLIESGNDVPLVALGDTIAPGPHVRPIPRAERHAAHVQTLRQSDWPQRLEYVFGLVRRTLAYRVWEAPRERRINRKEDRRIDLAVARGESIPPSLRGRHVTREHGRLLAGHEARPPFPSRVLLLRTDGPFDTPDRGWGPIVGSALEIVDLPGTHSDLGREASGAYVGPALRRELGLVAVGPSAPEAMGLSGQGAS